MGKEVKTVDEGQLVTDYSKGIFGTSNNFIMATRMATALAESTIVPKEYQKNAPNCLIAIEQAQRLGVSPLMVMQNLYVIQGRPSWSSKFLIAAINASGRFDQPLQFKEEKDKNGQPFACTAWTTLNGEIIEGMKVDMDIAKKEGWLGKNGSKWQTMPQLMLRYRAASFFSSLNCPDITMGLYTSEEAEEMGEPDVTDVISDVAADVASITATEVPAIPEPMQTAPMPAKAPEKPQETPQDADGQMAMPGF